VVEEDIQEGVPADRRCILLAGPRREAAEQAEEELRRQVEEEAAEVMTLEGQLVEEATIQEEHLVVVAVLAGAANC
jgi:hypothetical protein